MAEPERLEGAEVPEAAGQAESRPAGVRRRAREFAFSVLFQAEQGGGDVLDVLEHAQSEFGQRGVRPQGTVGARGRAEAEDPYSDPLDAEALAFARQLAFGYDEKRYSVDQTLAGVIEGWTFGQMAKTDLAVLRLASYEMMFESTPHPPVIEVAVRIAKKYGGEESGKFVNGVLARLKRHLDLGDQGATSTE